MADTPDKVKIGEISSQLTKASRLVLSTDGFWIQTGGDSQGNGQSVLIPAEFVRAYLTVGISPSVGDDGNWYINGKNLGVKAEGVTPQLRGGTLGIEVSYDKGATWKTAVLYSDMDIDLDELEKQYKKTIEGEQQRVEHEIARITNETARQANEQTRQSNEQKRIDSENARIDAEKARVNAENARVATEKTRTTQETARVNAETARGKAEKERADAETARANAETARVKAENARQTAETARGQAETARQNAETARGKSETTRAGNENSRIAAENNRVLAERSREGVKALMEELNNHPPKMGDNGNWWQWSIAVTPHAYVDTGILARGGVMWPTFQRYGNKLYLHDYGTTTAERVEKHGNKLYIKL